VSGAGEEGASQVKHRLLGFKDLTEITMRLSNDEIRADLNRAYDTIATQAEDIMNMRSRVERAEREAKDKGMRIVDLLVRIEQAERDLQREHARANSLYHQRIMAEQRLSAATKPRIEAESLRMPSIQVDVRGIPEVRDVIEGFKVSEASLKGTVEALKRDRDSALRQADKFRLKLETIRDALTELDRR